MDVDKTDSGIIGIPAEIGVDENVIKISKLAFTDKPAEMGVDETDKRVMNKPTEIPDIVAKRVDILSFDGGGSRGIMEVAILSDVMRLATLVLRDPNKLSYLTTELNKENVKKINEEIRKQLVEDIDKVSDPIHPSEIYNMIVGTSTGALIAFGLVGGNKGDYDKRMPMTLDECVTMYLEKTKDIFSKSWSHWFISHIPGLGSIPLTTYPKSNVKIVLQKQFGESTLADFGESCVAGAVAKQIGQKEELVLFDTKSESCTIYKTYQVLLATSNAPVYFDTPVKIGEKKFVDGGVGGNCPLAQATTRAKELFGNKATTALSIAPPSPKESDIPSHFQIKYWLNYFIQQSTDGYAVYKDTKHRNKGKTDFRRLSPRGERLKDFKLDERNAEKMLDAIHEERLSKKMFLVDVIATAMVVVDTYIDKANGNIEKTTVKMGAELAQIAGNLYLNASKPEYKSARNSYNTSLSLWKKLPNEDAKEATGKISDNIAKCFKEQGKYKKAIKLYQSSVKHWQGFFSGSDSPNTTNALINLAECLLLSYDYKTAEEKLGLALKMLHRMHAREEKANPDVWRVLDNIGWCHYGQKKFAEAIKFFNDALEMKRELYSNGDHVEKAETLNNIGLCFLGLLDVDKAVTYVKEAYKMRKNMQKNGMLEKKEEFLIAESLNNIGLCCIKKEDFEEAHKQIEKALAIAKRVYGDVNHPFIAVILTSLASCMSQEKGQSSNKALLYINEALDMEKACYGDVDNAGIADTLFIAGRCFERADKYEEAVKMFQKSSKMRKNLELQSSLGKDSLMPLSISDQSETISRGKTLFRKFLY